MFTTLGQIPELNQKRNIARRVYEQVMYTPRVGPDQGTISLNELSSTTPSPAELEAIVRPIVIAEMGAAVTQQVIDEVTKQVAASFATAPFVRIEAGKGLSTNDYTNADKSAVTTFAVANRDMGVL